MKRLARDGRNRSSWVRRSVAALTALAALVIAQSALGEPDGAFLSRYAEASFVKVDSSGCIATTAFPRLIPTAGLVSQGDGEITTFAPNSAFADLLISVFDTCQNTIVSWAYGEATVPSSSFSFHGNGLKSATLDAQISICDRDLETFECIPGTTRAVVVNVVWTGIGEVVGPDAVLQRNVNPPVYVSITGGSGAARVAEANGAIVDGTTDYAAGVTGQGVLSRFTAITLGVIP